MTTDEEKLQSEIDRLKDLIVDKDEKISELEREIVELGDKIVSAREQFDSIVNDCKHMIGELK